MSDAESNSRPDGYEAEFLTPSATTGGARPDHRLVHTSGYVRDVGPPRSAGCHACGDTLQEIKTSAPDHGLRRPLTLLWCMDCAAVRAALVGAPAPPPSDWQAPIQQAVDDYLLMERKARAWDELVARASSCDVTARDVLDADSELYAHSHSTC